ncbi:hypothetical protein H4R20_001641 [Coemansia guatemalensis]|uniref:CCHC-type domain-containing protein n=1 Tax=Coemansia guatemalensis TaxID=2761395 RepID=A0A9W8I2Z2_9FUNG|nr:hypothetical protein H4R20_001641 [Coemansia guatemalensis]
MGDVAQLGNVVELEDALVVQIQDPPAVGTAPAARFVDAHMAPLRLSHLSADASDRDAIAWVAMAEHLADLLGVHAEQALMYVDPVLFSAWSTWRNQQPLEHVNGWAGFAAYIHLYRNPQNTHRGLAFQLLQLSDEGHMVLTFNDEFRRLYQALGKELGDVAIAMYTSRLPVGLRLAVFALGPDVTLDMAMQVVAMKVEAVRQAETTGNFMEIDAIGFGAFLGKRAGKRAVNALNGRSHGCRQAGSSKDSMRKYFGKHSVATDVFDAHWANRQCLRCGSSDHLANHCPSSFLGNANGRQ